MLFKELITNKAKGGVLSASDIQAFTNAAADEGFPREQISAMCMAILCKGMVTAEMEQLTMSLAKSGTIIDWAQCHLDGPLVDKHSTGGVGDKVSFPLAAILAACGAYVPMISGRGLGHTGGTLDKLESIPGYQVCLPIEKFKQVVSSVGCAIVSQSPELAPAEGKLYSIRDVTGSVESIPLIVSSILAKKYVAGNQALVMDVKTGNGAFMQTLDSARELAKTLIDTANGINLKTVAIISDMSQVLGRSAGNSLEILESIRYLRNEYREPRLDEVVLESAVQMLMVTKMETTREAALARAELAITSGAAAEVFAHLVAQSGGPKNFMEYPEKHLPTAPIIRPVFTVEQGIVSGVDVKAIGYLIASLGGGRKNANDQLDYSVGLDKVASIGYVVDAYSPLGIIHAQNMHSYELAAQTMQQAFSISQSPCEAPNVILQRLA
jgi:thymidine phosphorylase